MTRVAANLSLMFTEVPLRQRIEHAAAAGFRAVEIQFPYELPAQVLREELDRHHVTLVLHNLPPGDWAAGERGIACIPGREAEFREGVERAIHYAHTLKVPRLNCLCGLRPEGVHDDALRATVVANLRFAAQALQGAGLTLLIEPINPFDMPGFWLTRTAQALELIDEVGAPNLKLQYDLYHAQRTEGELAATLERHLDRIGHIQFADNPGRHEPGTGEIRFEFLFRHLQRLGWRGDLGAEYRPSGRTEDSLAWLAPLHQLFPPD